MLRIKFDKKFISLIASIAIDAGKKIMLESNKKKIEFNVGQFIKLKNYAKKLKLDFSASCFDIESYKLMNKE